MSVSSEAAVPECAEKASRFLAGLFSGEWQSFEGVPSYLRTVGFWFQWFDGALSVATNQAKCLRNDSSTDSSFSLQSWRNLVFELSIGAQAFICGVKGIDLLCCAVLDCAVLCFSALCFAVLGCTVLCFAVLGCALLCCDLLCGAVLCCDLLHCAVLICALLCCALLCCSGLFCAELCCVMLCCACSARLCSALL